MHAYTHARTHAHRRSHTVYRYIIRYTREHTHTSHSYRRTDVQIIYRHTYMNNCVLHKTTAKIVHDYRGNRFPIQLMRSHVFDPLLFICYVNESLICRHLIEICRRCGTISYRFTCDNRNLCTAAIQLCVERRVSSEKRRVSIANHHVPSGTTTVIAYELLTGQLLYNYHLMQFVS